MTQPDDTPPQCGCTPGGTYMELNDETNRWECPNCSPLDMELGPAPEDLEE
jgi:rubredoxin